MANVGGYSPSYSWVGKPTQFNGTNQLTGGDSCELPVLARTNSAPDVDVELCKSKLVDIPS